MKTLNSNFFAVSFLFLLGIVFFPQHFLCLRSSAYSDSVICCPVNHWLVVSLEVDI